MTRLDLTHWHGVPRPQRQTLDGRYARLEPLEGRHVADLFRAAAASGAAERFRYLPDDVPADEADLSAWVARWAASTDPLLFAVVDKATSRAEGRQAYLRIDPGNGVIEIGHILWGPAIARTRVATEAFHLLAAHAFDLGYRRFEWKCTDRNEPSKRAALRFGFTFEGVFRNHMVVKDESRDTAWFSVIDIEWPAIDAAFRRWLDPANFDASGRQKRRLDELRTA